MAGEAMLSKTSPNSLTALTVTAHVTTACFQSSLTQKCKLTFFLCVTGYEEIHNSYLNNHHHHQAESCHSKHLLRICMNSATKQRGCGNKDLWLKTKVYILRQSAAYEMRHSMKAKKKKRQEETVRNPVYHSNIWCCSILKDNRWTSLATWWE